MACCCRPWAAWTSRAVPDLAYLTVYLLSGIGISLIAGAMRRSQRRWRETADELQASEQRFRGTFENAGVGITHTDMNGCWLRVNQKLCDIMGYTHEEMLGKCFPSMTHPEDLPADWDLYTRLMRGQINNYHLEKRYIRKDGQWAWMEIHRSLQRDPAGRPVYAITIAQDISARKQAQEALAERERLACPGGGRGRRAVASGGAAGHAAAMLRASGEPPGCRLRQDLDAE